jgi:hypothetical protein
MLVLSMCDQCVLLVLRCLHAVLSFLVLGVCNYQRHSPTRLSRTTSRPFFYHVPSGMAVWTAPSASQRAHAKDVQNAKRQSFLAAVQRHTQTQWAEKSADKLLDAAKWDQGAALKLVSLLSFEQADLRPHHEQADLRPHLSIKQADLRPHHEQADLRPHHGPRLSSGEEARTSARDTTPPEPSFVSAPPPCPPPLRNGEGLEWIDL